VYPKLETFLPLKSKGVEEMYLKLRPFLTSVAQSHTDCAIPVQYVIRISLATSFSHIHCQKSYDSPQSTKRCPLLLFCSRAPQYSDGLYLLLQTVAN